MLTRWSLSIFYGFSGSSFVSNIVEIYNTLIHTFYSKNQLDIKCSNNNLIRLNELKTSNNENIKNIP